MNRPAFLRVTYGIAAGDNDVAMFQPPPLAFHPPTFSGLRSPLPWVIVLISVVCTLAAWTVVREEARHHGQRVFHMRAEAFDRDLRTSLLDIQTRLRVNAARLAVNARASPAAWRESLTNMNLGPSHPGLKVVGFSSLEATTARTVQVFPRKGMHDTAVNYDLFSDDSLRTALAPVLTGGAQTTFAHSAPWIRADRAVRYLWMVVPVGPGNGANPPRGLMWVLVRMDELLTGIAGALHPHLHMSVHLGERSTPDSVLYDSRNITGMPAGDGATEFTHSAQIDLANALLTLRVGSDGGILDGHNPAAANLILAGGLAISALLFLITWYSASQARKARAQALRMASESSRVEARMQGIISTAMDAIVCVDTQQRITLFNSAAESIFGYRASEVLGQPLDLLIPAPQRGRHHDHMRRFGETGNTARSMGADIEVNGLRANGEVFPIDASISRLRDGEHIIFTVILRDISRRRQSEQALVHTQRSLETSNERLRQLSLHVETTREAERIRVAREIHDDLAATLTGIKMDLSAAREALRDDPQRTDQRLRASLALMDAAVLTTRRIINDLRPSILDNLGVWAAIEWLAGETGRRADIQCEAQIDPALEQLPMPPALSTALFRIVQEALNNVWHHADASRAVVRCAQSEGHLEVVVTDNGKGMDADALHRPGHWGLLGMEERARSHGGSITIDSAKGRGTSILVRFPLPASG